MLIIFSIVTLSSYAESTQQILFETSQLFHPVIGKNGAVATQEKYATDIGLDILKQGGNAVDAAVAIGYALAVTLPRAGNLGGGGFMTIWINNEQKAYVINYRETTPSKIDIKKIQELPQTEFIRSLSAAGVPGTVSGLNLAVEKFGSKPLKQLIEPAINLAKDGFIITETQLQSLNFADDLLSKDSEAKKIFFNKKTNRPYQLGELLIQKDLARTLKLISDNNTAGFYQGETADRIANYMSRNKGYITKKDLENYQARIVEPVKTKYRDYNIYSPPPPSSGGIILAEILKILEKIDINKYTYNTADYYHILTEVFNYSYLDRNYGLGDPLFVDNNIEQLLSDKHIKNIIKKIDTKKHTPSVEIDTKNTKWQEGKNTTHYVVIDKDYNIVSNTYTLNYSFGTGKIIPGTGFFINNELDDFTINLGTANAYGLIQGKKNIIEPGKQPLSSMTPTIITTKDNIPYLATGTPGGSRIITTVAQIILNMINNNQNLSTAVANPRIHSQLWPDILYYEQGISQDSIDKLNKMGHITKQTDAIGSAQSVQYLEPYVYSTKDYRRAGAHANAY
jgi:gamma-glutamyltranspeptidase/glutathione hydrolase